MLFRSNSLSRKYRKLGYGIDQEGILTRFLREGDAWKTHLQNTQDFIIRSYTGKSYKSIAVLGSGWLLDVPVEKLIQDFESIYFIDIVHPPQIKYKYRNFSHIHFIEADVTGGVALWVYDMLYAKAHTKSADIVKYTYTPFVFPVPVDFVVSLNILNQLDILLVDAIKSRIRFEPEDEQFFRLRLQQEHLLHIQHCNYCLISDWEQITYDANSPLGMHTPLVFVESPPCSDYSEWMWDFDASGLYQNASTVKFVVRAFCR